MAKKKASKPKRANGGPSILNGNGLIQDLVTDPIASAEAGMQVVTVTDGDAETQVMPEDGVIEIRNPDATITLEFAPPVPKKPKNFDDNIAEELAETSDGQIILGRIAMQLLESIEQDDRDRSEWLQQRADGLDLLGMKVEKPGAGNVGSSSTAVAGQSTVRDALLAEACDRFQANSFAELCPSEGPAKVMSYGGETLEDDDLANALEDDLNFYLTGSAPETAKEYYPDTRKMLWWVGYSSGMFKKVYRCPIRQRPVSESVDGSMLIVPSTATDLQNAERVTEQIDMNHTVMMQMQLQKAYRKVDLTRPNPTLNVLQQKEGTVTGMNPNLQRPEDQHYTIFECYTNLDIEGYEHKRKGKATGLPVPYRVVIDKDSRTVLEIRRNWKLLKQVADDDGDDETDDLPVANIPYVQFSYASGLGFYGTGLLQRLGNYTMALTSMLRESIDAGMFASFPGFLYAKPAGRQLQSEFRVPPGGGAPIDVSAVGGDINRAVLPLPYKDVSTAMVALMDQTRQTAQRYGGTAEAPTSEGTANAPVGSVLAAIDQATRIEGGVHKALYAAQREELQKLIELFKEDPSAIWRGNPYPAMGQDKQIRVARFQEAMERYYLVPASDPNVPSNMHRQAKASAYLQTAMQLLPANVFNMKKVIIRWAKMLKIDGVEGDLMPDMPPPDPTQDPQFKLAQQKIAIDAQKAQTQHIAAVQKGQNDQQKTMLQANVEAAKIAQTHAASFGTEQPDPFKRQELEIKQQSVNQAGKKIMLDAHNAHLEREARLREKALDIGKELAVHPQSQPVVNSELGDLSPLTNPQAEASPGASGAGMAEGGPVTTGPMGTVGGRMDDEAAKAEKLRFLTQREHLASQIADVLRKYNQRPLATPPA